MSGEPPNPKVEPALTAPEPCDPVRVLERAAARARAGVRIVLATVMARRGSAPGTPGQKLYLAADGSSAGTVGGGAVEREVLSAMQTMLTGASDAFAFRTFRLGPELGMCCGGGLDVAIETLATPMACLVVGGGHVGSAVAPLLARLGFAVSLVDPREAWGKEGRLEGVRTLVGDYDDAGADFPAEGCVLVMTHDHALDQQVIEWALRRGVAFVGGIGSRAKAQRTRDRLAAKGFSEADCARVRMPLGLGIGARLPEEIAVSVAAELIEWRRRSGEGRGP